MPTLAVTTGINSTCLECGIVQKSGKLSCCGRGGSWFGNCVNAANAKVGRTWYEGIRVCKSRQFQTAVHYQHARQQKVDATSDDSGVSINVFLANGTIVSLVNPTSIPKVNGTIFESTRTALGKMRMMTPSHTSDIRVREWEGFLYAVTYISLNLPIGCWY